MHVEITFANIVTAHTGKTIGTKITDIEKFRQAAILVIAEHDFPADRIPGQGFIPCPEGIPFVSAGVGRRTTNPDDYVLREHRGTVEAYLKRKKAEPVMLLSLIVYTKEAYLADPDVKNDPEETTRINHSCDTHVIVAILASAGPNKSPLTPHRLVHNLAGGNKEAATWTADEIRTKAEESKAYHDEWCVVAD